MNRKKSLVFIILFALLVNILHGFFIHHHNDMHSSSVHKNIKDAHQMTHDICDECQHIHLSFIVDIVKVELPYIEQNRPTFYHKRVYLSIFFPPFLRPPIV